MTRFLALALASAAILPGLAQRAAAQSVNLFTNGDFNTTTNGEGAYYTGTGTAPSGSTQAVGWNACATTSCNSADGGYPFLFIATPGIADGNASGPTTGFADPWDDSAGAGNSSKGIAYRSLWGAGNGGVGQDGQTADAFNGRGPLGASDPNNFLIADGDYHKTAIGQTVNGLVVGDHYSLSFAWAAAQWDTFSGATTEQWQVSFGNSTGYTSVYSLNSHSFSGWMNATLNFTATSTSEALSFLAYGTPVGEPPMLLLDDVAMYDTPEPAALATMVVGVGCLGAMVRRRRMAGAAA